MFYELITKQINFLVPDEDMPSALTLNENRYLFEILVLSYFFKEIMPTKPLAIFAGSKGSGKSMTAKKVGRLLFGKGFQVQAVPKTEDSFNTLLTNNELVCLDNADTINKLLDDKIAVCCTGGRITKRVLYTTNQLYEVDLTCNIMVTSRVPGLFSRDDVADRSLVYELDRIKPNEFIEESQLLEEIDKNRNVIMGCVFKRLKRVLKNLRDNKDLNLRSQLRMADFGNFAKKYALMDNKADYIDNIFNKIKQEQANLALESDPLVELLSRVIDAGHGNKVSTATLCGLLKNQADQKKIKFEFSVKGLGRRLMNLKSELEQHFDVSVHVGGKNIRYWTFAHKK